jgi:UDP-N-acetylglucosamine diphosphorylase/glucosamine-1-phosphate N-acetyltransferase
MPRPALYLFEPEAPGPEWAPFARVRPIAELRAGVWRIRERWESALDSDTTAILGTHIAGFHEGFEPPCQSHLDIRGPALVAASWFAPTGAPVDPPPGACRLECLGETVAWVVPDGARWNGPFADGAAATVEGLRLRGVADLLSAMDRYLGPDCLGLKAAEHDPVPAGSIVLGDAELVVCRSGLVEPGVVFDTRAGAVVIEEGVEVRSGARLEGPLYAGARSRLLGGYLKASVFGPRSVVRGEITNSLFLGYANKAHDGFVGHSVIGHWVNLGALTTTSNLKNTYGEVSLQVGDTQLATNRQLLGSLIGDHAKTAIGTMLATGTVVGAGANVFGSPTPPKYVPPMAWGAVGHDRLTEDGFLKIAARVMPRRDVELTAERAASLVATYRRLTE